MERFILVRWPEVQNLMEEPWFRDEVCLDVESKYGDSAYFVPENRLVPWLEEKEEEIFYLD